MASVAQQAKWFLGRLGNTAEKVEVNLKRRGFITGDTSNFIIGYRSVEAALKSRFPTLNVRKVCGGGVRIFDENLNAIAKVPTAVGDFVRRF